MVACSVILHALHLAAAHVQLVNSACLESVVLLYLESIKALAQVLFAAVVPLPAYWNSSEMVNYSGDTVDTVSVTDSERCRLKSQSQTLCPPIIAWGWSLEEVNCKVWHHGSVLCHEAAFQLPQHVIINLMGRFRLTSGMEFQGHAAHVST
jgi:hypothetical protein